jgi:hypothetical protein
VNASLKESYFNLTIIPSKAVPFFSKANVKFHHHFYDKVPLKYKDYNNFVGSFVNTGLKMSYDKLTIILKKRYLNYKRLT